jgi:hypothetical protein
MVTAGKIFKLNEDIQLSKVSDKLRNYRQEETFEQKDQELNLIKEIQGCSLSKEGLLGIFSEDVVLSINQHGTLISVPKTRRAPFLFSIYNEKILLTILEKKPVANNVANQLTKILGIEIVEGRITSEALRRFHESNPEETKIIFFEDIDIPNVEKLSLYGSNLANTTLYDEYCKRGRIWYIVITSKKSGNIVGITGDCVVTVFNKIDQKNYFNYVADEIFTLIA